MSVCKHFYLSFPISFFILFITCFLLLPGFSNSVMAKNNFFIGARGTGMAGANVACVNDETAQYYNPAAFGFFGKKNPTGNINAFDNNNLSSKNWGFSILDAGAGAKMTGELPDHADTLREMAKTFDSGINIESEEQIKSLTGFVPAVQGINDSKEGVLLDFNAGTGVRVKNYGIGARMLFQGGSWVDADTNYTMDLGVTVDSTNVNDQIENVSYDPPTGYSNEYITEENGNRAKLGSLSNASVAKIDYAAKQQGLSQSEVNTAVDALNSTLTNGTINFNNVVGSGDSSSSSNGSLQDNDSKLYLRSFGVGEVPVSYGHTVSDHWSVGGNFKLMRGRVYAESLQVFDENATEDFGENFTEDYKQSTNFGIDLGVMGRYKMFNVGLIGINLNSPSFDGPTIDGKKIEDVELDPRYRMGVAFIPRENITIEVDYDLNAYDSMIQKYEIQNIALGAEWDIYNILALRLGTYKNLAEDNIGTVFTGGIGLNFWLARLDVAGAVSADTLDLENEEDIDIPMYGNNPPKEARVNAKLTVDF